MKTLVILASVAALMMISINDRLHQDNDQHASKELVAPAPAFTISTGEKQVYKTADSTSQTSTNFLASGKYTKNIFIIL